MQRAQFGVVAAFGALVAGAIIAPVAAQSLPEAGGAAASCALSGNPAACLGIAVGVDVPQPVVVVVPIGTDTRGGPLHENGGRDVDVVRSTRHGWEAAR